MPAQDYLPYPRALALLQERLNATPEELAAWIWMGPEDGGIAAYLNANELESPDRFYFPLCLSASEDAEASNYVAPLMACWFLKADIERFDPPDRFVTSTALVRRWSIPGLDPAAFIRAKILESRLHDLHPVFGGTQWSEPGNPHCPSQEFALFSRSEFEGIERDELAPLMKYQPESVGGSGQRSSETHTGLPGRPTTKAIIMREFQRVVAANTLEPTLTKQAGMLKTIIEAYIREHDLATPAPTSKTISNQIRDAYRKARRSP